MSTNEIPYLKGIGIRIHTVRYQKVRKRVMIKDLDSEHGDEDDVGTRERRRINCKYSHALFHFSTLCCVTEELRNVCPNYFQPRRKEDWTLLPNKSASSIKKTSSTICLILSNQSYYQIIPATLFSRIMQ